MEESSMDLAMLQNVHHLTESCKHVLTSQESCYSIQPTLAKSNAAPHQLKAGSGWIVFDAVGKAFPQGPVQNYLVVLASTQRAHPMND
jgi:cephalosporin hydroxylase